LKRTLKIEEADMKEAMRLLQDEKEERDAEELANLEAAQRLQAEEEMGEAERASRIAEDAALARRLLAEEEQEAAVVANDGAVAAALQREHGEAGRMLSRAWELDAFLQAPLGALPLPGSSDMHPETLRRVVALSQEHARRRLRSEGGQAAAAEPSPTSGRAAVEARAGRVSPTASRPAGSSGPPRSRFHTTGAVIANGL